MKPAIELPPSLRNLPEPWNGHVPLVEARLHLSPSEANVRTALDVAARGLEESLRVPAPGNYDGFPEIYQDDMICAWNPIDVAIETLDDFSLELAARALHSREPISSEQLIVVASDWLRAHVFELTRSALIWVAEARQGQRNAPEVPDVYALCDRYLESVTPDLGVTLLSAIWDIAREGANPRFVAAAQNPKLTERVRRKAEFLHSLAFEDPNELKNFILSGEPALPQDRPPKK